MQEMRVQSLGWEDLLDEKMATHSSILAREIPWIEEPGMLQSIGSQKFGLDLVIQSVQSLSHVRLFATPWTAADQASLFITNSRSLLKLMSIMSVMLSNHLLLCCLLLLPHGERNGKSLQYSCLKNPMNSMKRLSD